MRPTRYTPRRSALELTPEMADLVRRRTLPFLEHGTHLPLERILADCYLQGARDTFAAIEHRVGSIFGET